MLQNILPIQSICVRINTSFIPEGTQVSRLGTESFIPMFHLAVIATTLTCMESHALVEKFYEYKISDEVRAEMIQIVVEETPYCWDAKDD